MRMNDPVNHPAHYTDGTIECIDAIEAALTPEEFRGYCKGNAIKYAWRERHKGQDESLAKARWYINRLLDRTADTSSGAGPHSEARLGNRESSAAPKSKPGPCQLHDTDWYPPHNVDEVIFIGTNPGLTD